LQPSDVKYFVPVVLVCAVWRRSCGAGLGAGQAGGRCVSARRWL